MARCFQEIVLLMCYHGWVLLVMKTDDGICQVVCGEPYSCVSDVWVTLTVAGLRRGVRKCLIQQDCILVGPEDRCLFLATTSVGTGRPSLHTGRWSAVNRALKAAGAQVSIQWYDLLPAGGLSGNKPSWRSLDWDPTSEDLPPVLAQLVRPRQLLRPVRPLTLQGWQTHLF